MSFIEKAVTAGLSVAAGAVVANFIKQREQDSIPAPQAPPAATPAHRPTVQPQQLMVPYAMEERARSFIHLLARSNNKHLVPQGLKEAAVTWLEDYDKCVLQYMTQAYGMGVFPLMDRITRAIFDHTHQEIAAHYGDIEASSLSALEKQFEEGGDDGPAGSPA